MDYEKLGALCLGRRHGVEEFLLVWTPWRIDADGIAESAQRRFPA